MAKNLYGLSLSDIMPASIANDPQVWAMMLALDPEINSVSASIREAFIYSRIDELPEHAIDLLAEQFHVDFYEPVGLSLEARRNIVKSALMVHRKKGTPWAVRRLMTDLGFQVDYSEWWQFNGQPYVDKLKVWIGDDFDFTPESRDLIMRAWHSTKAARTHLESLFVGIWFLDEFGEILDGENDFFVRAAFPFADLYPWIGLRYGDFTYGGMIAYGDFAYGDGTKYGGGTRGTRCYGEDTPDILAISALSPQGLEDMHAVPAVYGQVRYGDFTYGSSDGVQDSGGEVVFARSLTYGRFFYGQGMTRYGDDDAIYGSFSYGGSVKYGGEIIREAI
jgi:phage tail P2-like protein